MKILGINPPKDCTTVGYYETKHGRVPRYRKLWTKQRLQIERMRKQAKLKAEKIQ